MLKFAVCLGGKPADSLDLGGAYLFGSDEVPVRAELSFRNGIITCQKRAAGPAGLGLLWTVRDAGTLLMETIRVPEREEPYILQVELARARLARLNEKVEDWGLWDHIELESLLPRLNRARDLLIEALQAEAPGDAARLADESLAESARAGEEVSHLHAHLLLNRRKQTGGLSGGLFGCVVNVDRSPKECGDLIAEAFDFATIPMAWRSIEPTEQDYQFKAIDEWVDWLSNKKIPIRGSGLLALSEESVPDWLYIWEHDFETIRDLAFEHVKRVIKRYGDRVHTWDVVNGLHMHNTFSFSFEQIMELTRMAAAATKQESPHCTSVINLIAPWGEYYARNQRTIPPLLYAEMVLQSGVNFDAFGVHFRFGLGQDGGYTRDMFQISSMLDQVGKLGKPVHITAAGVPSAIVKGKAGNGSAAGGFWRKGWSEQVQAQWLRQFVEVALSKPFVEKVCWQGLCDDEDAALKHGGLLGANAKPKAAYRELLKLRSELLDAGQRP